MEKLIPDPRLSLAEGAVEPLGKRRANLLFAMLEMLGRRYDFTLDDPVETLSETALNAVLYGDSEPVTVDFSAFNYTGSGNQLVSWEGVAEYISRVDDEDSKRGQKWRGQFLVYRPCSVCGGSRLKRRLCNSAWRAGTSPRCRRCRSPTFRSGWPASGSSFRTRSAASPARF